MTDKLIRDPNSKAVINTDRAALESYRLSKAKRREKDIKIQAMGERIEYLEKTVSEILKRIS